jgi:hypothetical protein
MAVVMAGLAAFRQWGLEASTTGEAAEVPIAPSPSANSSLSAMSCLVGVIERTEAAFTASLGHSMFQPSGHWWIYFLLLDMCFALVCLAWSFRKRGKPSETNVGVLIGDACPAFMAVDSEPIGFASVNSAPIVSSTEGLKSHSGMVNDEAAGAYQIIVTDCSAPGQTSTCLRQACNTSPSMSNPESKEEEDRYTSNVPPMCEIQKKTFSMMDEKAGQVPEAQQDGSIALRTPRKRSVSRGTTSRSATPKGVQEWLARRRTPNAKEHLVEVDDGNCPEHTPATRKPPGLRKAPRPATAAEHTPPAKNCPSSTHSPSIQPRGVQEWLVRHQASCKPSSLDDSFQASASVEAQRPIQTNTTPSRSGTALV